MSESEILPAPIIDPDSLPKMARIPSIRELRSESQKPRPLVNRKGTPMSYRDYDLVEVVRQFGIDLSQSPLFPSITPCEPPSWLREALYRARNIAWYSEKSRSEFIIAPILLACREIFGEDCAIYSGIRLDVDAEKGLRGECDFILARSRPTPMLRAPVLVVVEVKKTDLEDGLGQCIAQMIAAQKFNEIEKSPRRFIHGCVTSSQTWQFLRLEGGNLVIDSEYYYLLAVEKILGILLAIMGEQV